MESSIDAAIAAAFVVLLAWAAWGDIRAYRISNRLIVAFFLLFIAAFAAGTIPRSAILDHLGAGALALALGLALFSRNWIGGGDAKLFAVLALWTSWPDLIRLSLVMALAGGVLAVLVAIRGRGAERAPETANDGAPDPRRKVPYGVAIALAGLDFWLRRLAAPVLLT